MVDFQLDEMQEMLRELAHEFAVDEIRPNAEHWDLNSEYPKDAINAAHEMGILNLHISEEYGGPGLGIMEEVLVNVEERQSLVIEKSFRHPCLPNLVVLSWL